ncbi:MAG: TolC family protein [Candidatus Magnetomorum sp.]|nr:TolC family protein [Candidatus Magnetomorum sp.]
MSHLCHHLYTKTNMKRTITIVSCIFFVFFSHTLFALTLEDLQNAAVQNRKLIEKYRIQISQQETALKMNNSRYWPTLDIDYSLTKSDKHHSRISQYTEFESILSYSLFSGFDHYFQKHALDRLKNSKTFELNSMVQDIKYIVSANYLHLFDSKSLLTVAEDEFNLLKKRYHDAQNRHKVGIIKKNDLLKIQVEMDHAEQQRDKASAAFDKNLDEIAYETGMTIDFDEMPFNEFKALPETKDRVFYLSRAARRNEIKTLEQLIASEEMNVQSLHSKYYPSIDLAAEYYRYDDDYFFGAGEHEEQDIRLKLSMKMNLFNGFKDYHSILSKKMDVNRLKCDLEELNNKLANEVDKTFSDYNVSVKNLKVSQKSIAQAEENLRITDMSFNQGLATTADILDAIYYLSRAKYNYIYAGGELFLNYYKLTRLADDF